MKPSSQANDWGWNSLSIPRHSFFSYPFLFKMWDDKLSPCSNCKNKVNPKLKMSCYMPFLFTWLGLGTQTYMRLSVILRSKLNKTVINIG